MRALKIGTGAMQYSGALSGLIILEFQSSLLLEFLAEGVPEEEQEL